MIKIEDLTGYTGYRPRGWNIIATGIVQRYQRSVMALICDDEAAKQRAVGEAFASAVLSELRRNNGCKAIVLPGGRLTIYPETYHGEPREVMTNLTFVGDWGFSGPGLLVFIPDDPVKLNKIDQID